MAPASLDFVFISDIFSLHCRSQDFLRYKKHGGGGNESYFSLDVDLLFLSECNRIGWNMKFHF